MISMDMLQEMCPEDAAALADILADFKCDSPKIACIWCPRWRACRFIKALYHEMKARSMT